jgi:hypothetical protein
MIEFIIIDKMRCDHKFAAFNQQPSIKLKSGVF